SSVAQQIDRLTEAYLSGVLALGEYQRRRKDLERRDDVLAAQEESLSGEASRAHELGESANSARAFAERVRVGLDTATFERKRQLVELLIDRVVVTGDDVEIRYAFPIGPAGETGRFCHLRVDYLRAPYLVGAGQPPIAEQVRIGPRLGRGVRGPRPGMEPLQAHQGHEPPDPLAIDRLPLAPQRRRHPPTPVEGGLEVLLVDQPH